MGALTRDLQKWDGGVLGDQDWEFPETVTGVLRGQDACEGI